MSNDPSYGQQNEAQTSQISTPKVAKSRGKTSAVVTPEAAKKMDKALQIALQKAKQMMSTDEFLASKRDTLVELKSQGVETKDLVLLFKNQGLLGVTAAKINEVLRGDE